MYIIIYYSLIAISIPILINPYINNIIQIINSVKRLTIKLLSKKKYKIPDLNMYDFICPPFPNSWYPICLSKEIKQNKKYCYEIAGKKIILFRNNENCIKVIPRYCPHMGVDLDYGKLNNNCIVCPFHNKHVYQETENKFYIEETQGFIFIWIDQENKEPPIKMEQLINDNDMKDLHIFPYIEFKHDVGGHLIDYAEHLIDVKHAPYIHNVDIEPVENGLKTTKYSFTTSFLIKEKNIKPIFTYATPSWGNIFYFKDTYVIVMFVVKNIGNMEMRIIPGWKGEFTVIKLFLSILLSLYTYIDFIEESAFFTTKNHNIRKMLPAEKPMNDFREWFINNYFTQEQVNKFNKNKEIYEKMKIINDW
jgi:nitrite reductase/ring-hydroxylating ferredoxin subunit